MLADGVPIKPRRGASKAKGTGFMALQERPLFPPRDSMNFRAIAAREVLRARAARICYVWVGLSPAVSCVLHQGPVQRDDLSGVVF